MSEGALVETGAQLAAGSVVPPGRRIPAGEVRCGCFMCCVFGWMGGWPGRASLSSRWIDGWESSLTPPNPTHPSNPTQLWGGNPVKFIRKLDDDEITANVKAAEQYHALASEHANEFAPFGAAYLDAEKAKTA